MLSSIGPASTPDGAVSSPPGPLRQASRDLVQALRSDDLDAARGAFVSLAKAMPEDAQWKPGSPFAALGKALVQGDIEAARTAAAEVFPHRPMGGGDRTAPVVPVPTTAVPSSTGGAAGSNLSVVA
jgi:hypothetical protein